jgi:hypothetical protein
LNGAVFSALEHVMKVGEQIGADDSRDKHFAVLRGAARASILSRVVALAIAFAGNRFAAAW